MSKTKSSLPSEVPDTALRGLVSTYVKTLTPTVAPVVLTSMLRLIGMMRQQHLDNGSALMCLAKMEQEVIDVMGDENPAPPAVRKNYPEPKLS